MAGCSSQLISKSIRLLCRRCYIFISLIFIVIALIACVYFSGNLDHEKNQSASEIEKYKGELKRLEKQKNKLTSQLVASKKLLNEFKEIVKKEKIAHQLTEKKENAYRKQSLALGLANDHLVGWIMRNKSRGIPFLEKVKSEKDIETIVSSLSFFLTQTEDGKEFQPIRARIMLQLAELLICQQKTLEADQMLDSAMNSKSKQTVESSEYKYRIARIRFACLIQALDQGKKELLKPIRDKLSSYLKETSEIGGFEPQRLQSLMHVVDGRMIQEESPAKALEHFLKAIELVQGMDEILKGNVRLRSDLARVSVEAASLAENLNCLNKASQLREAAAKLLKKLLDESPELQLPKVQLAKIYIMNATSDIRVGENLRGKTMLEKAEKLLKAFPKNDLSNHDAVIQIATAKGLRADLLRDAGKTSPAIIILNEAIDLVKSVMAQQEKTSSINNESLYSLSVLNWQLAGVLGDSGDHSAELKKGAEAASLMEKLLKCNGGKHDLVVRRALAYLYGDLAHTSALKKKHAEAVEYFNKAAAIWQSLITKYGKYEEYTDGLKWSKSRGKEQKAFH